MLADGRRWCRWHLEQASEGWADLPVLTDGGLSLAQLRRWAAEFDGTGAEAWSAAEFISWLRDSVGGFRGAEEQRPGRPEEELPATRVGVWRGRRTPIRTPIRTP